ncbi:DUF2178 domain-containing protein [Bacillus aerolatus]|uniref:DUF2178 domain-containing protein n=1 Tax=Bacillus aerolatus TaxID=2653354 RepID=UPI00384E5BCB
MINNLIGLSGLLLGAGITIVILFINRRIGEKKRLFDERQQYVTARAKAASWNITSVILLIAWAIIILYEGISFSFFLMTGIWVAHNFSLVFTATYFSNRN